MRVYVSVYVSVYSRTQIWRRSASVLMRVRACLYVYAFVYTHVDMAVQCH